MKFHCDAILRRDLSSLTVVGVFVLALTLGISCFNERDNRHHQISQVGSLADLIRDYWEREGDVDFPNENLNLNEIVSKFSIEGYFNIKDGSIVDPWGRAYRIFYNREFVLVISPGPNGQFEYLNNQRGDDILLERQFRYGSANNGRLPK